MAPFRPTNLNKRAYPGNAGVIGPTTNPTVGYTTTTCCTCFCNVCGPCTESLSLGCRCALASCSVFNCCCCCTCTVCTRSTPGGRYKPTETYIARTINDAWGNSTCSNGPQTGFCGPCIGSCTATGTDFKGYLLCCGASNTRWYVVPDIARVGGNYSQISATVVSKANQCMGSCGWFWPVQTEVYNPGYVCRTYWETLPTGKFYTNNFSPYAGGYAGYVDFGPSPAPGRADRHSNTAPNKNYMQGAAFRTTSP